MSTSALVIAEKRRVGRPNKYDPEAHPLLAFKYCLLGCDDAMLARNLEIGESTLNRWQHEHPEFRDSIKAGRDEADANMANSLYHKGLGYKHKVVKVFATKDGDVVEHEYEERLPPDTASAIFWLKNRRRDKWRDTPVVAVGVQTNGENISINMQPLEVSQSYMNLIESEE